MTQPYVLAYGGFTNTQTSMINTIRALSYLGCMFAAPLFFRTLGYRLGAAVAVAFSAVSFAVFAASKTLAGFYLGGVLAGIGYGFGSMIPATILINRWFHRKKGLAIGLCSASTGLAMIVFFSDPHGDLRNARAASLFSCRGRVLPRLRGAGLPAHPRVA